MNIELYINKQLCDIEDTKKFSIAFKRQFLNPAELNTKDAQKSYDITLPTTNRNNNVFGFKNVEEVQGKFAIIYDAYLIVGGVKIFDGKFRLSEIRKGYYKGNLGVPYMKPINQLFGEKKLKEAGEWLIDFNRFYETISKYNQDAKLRPQACIFPFILYGLVPKQTYGRCLINGEERDCFTGKLVIDDTTYLNFNDFPPAINPLKALVEIFKNEGYSLEGSAFNDTKLVNLYMSYKNDSSYPMQWNHGENNKVSLSGSWSNGILYSETEQPGSVVINKGEFETQFEKIFEEGQAFDDWMFGVNIFNADRHKYIINQNDSHSIVEKDNKIAIRVPKSGLYKIYFDAKLTLNTQGSDDTNRNWFGMYRVNEGHNQGNNFYSPTYGNVSNQNSKPFNNDLDNRRYELQLVRYTTDDFIDVSKQKILGVYHRPNVDQDYNDIENEKDLFYPNHKIQIDQSNNENFICGVSYGKNGKDLNRYYDSTQSKYHNMMFVKNGWSWDNSYSQKREIFSTNWLAKQNTSTDYLFRKASKVGESINFVESEKYRQSIENYKGYNDSSYDTSKVNSLIDAGSDFASVVYLEEGEIITLLSVSDGAKFYIGNQQFMSQTLLEWKYNLIIEPFRESTDWIKVDINGNGFEPMDWSEEQWLKDKIDLMTFLPVEDKIDTFIDNFCKAFNLSLVQTGIRTFELNVKQTRSISRTSFVIDLDNKAHVDRDRANSSLNLPSAYEIGFTVKQEEQGYIETGEDGGGKYITGNTENDTLKQTSTFSYNWYKQMYDELNRELPLFPIISDKEVWEEQSSNDYEDMQKKRYTNLAQRFFYLKDTYRFPSYVIAERPYLALVSSSLDASNILRLDYKNQPNTILTTYFNLLTNNENCYTTVDCYLTPEEYSNINNSIIKLNGDLYYIAEIDGYDPLGRRKATLKLIRKIL